jgi:hypothetical protein
MGMLPAALLNVLVLQTLTFSRSRLALSAVFVPLLAWLAYRTLPRLRPLRSKDWAGLLLATAMPALLACAALSDYPQNTYWLSSQRTVQVQTAQFSRGQTLDIKWLQTSLGDVSLGSFRPIPDWVSAYQLRTADQEQAEARPAQCRAGRRLRAAAPRCQQSFLTEPRGRAREV